MFKTCPKCWGTGEIDLGDPDDPEIFPCSKCKGTGAIRVGRGLVLVKPRRSLRIALRYWFPKRLTLSHNPKVHAWLWWNF